MSEHVSRETQCFKDRLQQQIALKRAGRRKNVNHEGTLCSGCYAEPPLPGQRYGANCNRKAALASYHRKMAARRQFNGLAENQNTSKGNDNEQREIGRTSVSADAGEPGGNP